MAHIEYNYDNNNLRLRTEGGILMSRELLISRKLFISRDIFIISIMREVFV